MTSHIIEHEDFQNLITALAKRGYQVVGPTIRDSAIVYDEIASVSDLPLISLESGRGRRR